MRKQPVLKLENTIHTRAKALVFRAKAFLLQTRRGAQNLLSAEIRRFPKNENLSALPVIAQSKTELWTESDPRERFLLAGKVHNLRLAVKRLNGLEIPANETFSFWKQLGRTSRLKGYTIGRELREGCIIPNVGGGLCQLSNALYDAALEADFEIVERHAHTQMIAGSLAEKGRDATVFWNYVDLRFRSPEAFRIEAALGRDHLRVVFKSERKRKSFVQIGKPESRRSKSKNEPNSCATCGVESCFRSLKPEANLDFGRTAYLVDEFSGEFDRYIQNARGANDLLLLPLDGKRFKKSNYAWTTKGFAKTRQSLFTTLRRAYRSRRLAAQGAARQKSLLAEAEKLAASYARKLSFDATHLVVSQNLLPFLWESGDLGGRTFDVLMTALPATELQKRLDFAFSQHRESQTLGDFRAAGRYVEAEREALKNARRIITPHAEIARLFGEKSVLLNWDLPKRREFARGKNEKFTIVFPASTVGRKGCYELREAIRDLDVKLVTLGAMIEDAEFWRGVDWEKGGDDWLERADAVVLPAFVEHKPRRLLLAAAHGIPVIASKACGVANVAGIKIIEAGEAVALRAEIEKLIKPNREKSKKLPLRLEAV